MVRYETMIGTVGISEVYLSKLIGLEVTSCFGVVGMVPNTTRQRLGRLVLRRNSADTGITVTGTEKGISVVLHIAVVYGMNINAIAQSITEKVKYAVDRVTGIPVDRVVVRVDSIEE